MLLLPVKIENDKFVVIWEEYFNTSRVLRGELSHSFSYLRNHNIVFLNDIHKHYSARIKEIENLYNSKIAYNAQSKAIESSYNGKFKDVYSYVDPLYFCTCVHYTVLVLW